MSTDPTVARGLAGVVVADSSICRIDGEKGELEYRGLGIGTRLLNEAVRRARRQGLDRLSLICFEKNRKAYTLYERLGFRDLARRSIVPHPFLNYREGDAILMACPCDAFNTD